jgi:hypothetical protein
MRWNKRVQWGHGVAGVLLISALAGCNRDEATVYHVPKETAPPSQPEPAAAPEMGLPPPAPVYLPQLKYQVPEGWREKAPSEMRVASFAVLGPNGQSADVSVIPLPVVGRDLELINMWRSRVQLPATTDPDAVKQAEPVAIGAEQGRLFDFASEQPMLGKSRQRILVAMLTRDTMSWFFKMTGEDQYVTSQKKHFLQFLKSVSFAENAPDQGRGTSTTTISVSPTTPDALNENANSSWSIPPGWQSLPPSQFLLAEFSIPGANGAKAEVNVAELSGEGGGLLANVNRWRGQLGLDAVGENELPQLAQSLDVPGGKATLVDFTGVNPGTRAQARLVGVIVSQNGQTWFYKLMGAGQIVAQQKNAFIKFIQSANYANAR